MQEELENQTEATESAETAEGSAETTETTAAEATAAEGTAAEASAEGGESAGTETAAEEVAAVAPEPSEVAPSEEEGEGEYKSHRKVRTGVVVSDKMDKSIVVQVTRRVRHPIYKKYFFKSKKFMAHDEGNDCRIGDTVRIVETRPLSAHKRWNLEKIVERAK